MAKTVDELTDAECRAALKGVVAAIREGMDLMSADDIFTEIMHGLEKADLDLSAIEPIEDFHGDPEACKESGQHLQSVDEDGYCNGCGEQG